MAKEVHIICSNVFKTSNKESFKEEFNKKMLQVIKQSESNKSCIGKIR